MRGEGERRGAEDQPGFQGCSKLLPAIKTPEGRRKARATVCGNLIRALQASLEAAVHDQYQKCAGGADGTLVKCLLRKAAHQQWGVATLDVRTAFLLAPRKKNKEQLLVTQPPRVLVEDEIWNAMYGLDTSPGD